MNGTGFFGVCFQDKSSVTTARCTFGCLRCDKSDAFDCIDLNLISISIDLVGVHKCRTSRFIDVMRAKLGTDENNETEMNKYYLIIK